jgi:hypothetical protein
MPASIEAPMTTKNRRAKLVGGGALNVPVDVHVQRHCTLTELEAAGRAQPRS